MASFGCCVILAERITGPNGSERPTGSASVSAFQRHQMLSLTNLNLKRDYTNIHINLTSNPKDIKKPTRQVEVPSANIISIDFLGTA